MKRILIGGFKHESNTFSDKPTTIEDYKLRTLISGEDVISWHRGTKSEGGGVIDVLDTRSDVCMVPSIFANACPAAPVTKETYDHVCGELLKYVREAAPLDGIILILHGAMITEESFDGEGTLLKMLRKEVGKDIPIVATLDFHANLSEDMVDNANALFPARYYPHTDFYERGRDAAEMMLAILDGKAHPVGVMKKLPLIYPHIATDEGALSRLIPMLIDEGKTEGVYEALFVAGFARADIPISNSAIYVVTENDKALAEKTCDKYYEDVLAHLEDYELQVTPPAEAVAEAIRHPGLTVIADAADNPGSGLMSDATEIIHELIRQGADRVCVSAVWDPETALQALKAGPGSTIHVKLGGKSSNKVGAPVETDAYVRSVGDGIYYATSVMCAGVKQNTGLTAVLEFNGITCIVCSVRNQTYDEEAFRANGIEPLRYNIVVVKSSVHFRAAWKLVTSHILTVDMPNITAFDERKIDFKNVIRPAYPLDAAETVREYYGRKK